MAERDKKRILCTPESLDRIRALVAATPGGDKYIVTASTLVPDNMVYLLQSDAEFEATTQEAFGNALHEQISRSFEQTRQRLEAQMRAEVELRRQAYYAVMVHSPVWTVTGL